MKGIPVTLCCSQLHFFFFFFWFENDIGGLVQQMVPVYAVQWKDSFHARHGISNCFGNLFLAFCPFLPPLIYSLSYFQGASQVMFYREIFSSLGQQSVRSYCQQNLQPHDGKYDTQWPRMTFHCQGKKTRNLLNVQPTLSRKINPEIRKCMHSRKS